jgi:hypothetical protein
VGIKPLEAHTDWYTNGTSPYQIANAYDYEGFKNLVNGGTNFAGKTVQLANSLAGWAFTPIGTDAAHSFKGTFDGNGYTLSNLELKSGTKNIGLFGYAGAGSIIENLHFTTSTIELSSNTTQIQYVGTIVGYSEGSIQNVTSSAAIDIESNLQPKMVNNKANIVGTMRDIGGIGGYVKGDISNSSYSGSITITSKANVLEYMRYIAGNIGGIVGTHGDAANLNSPAGISSCTNSGLIAIKLSGSGGKDRFGTQLLSVAAFVGGIAGYSVGNFSNCTNSGNLLTSPWDSNAKDSKGKPRPTYTAGRGAAYTGGIVGSLRGKNFDTAATEEGMGAETDPAYDAFIKTGGISGGSYPATISIKDCNNSGVISGLSVVGGIAGTTSSFSLIEASSNTGAVYGCRWNKPFTAGIAGTSRSNIRYCNNQGNIYSATGAGYYCCGIAGSFTTVNTTSTADNLRVPGIELTGCYATGTIYTETTGYRSGILVGENNGFIHANVYLPSLTLDGKVVADDDDKGNTTDNHELSIADIKASKGIAILNTYASTTGWNTFYVPDSGSGYPVLGHDITAGGSTSFPGGAITAPGTYEAVYSASIDPVPTVAATPDTLRQNADYRVIPAANTQGKIGGSYNAEVWGMGKYQNTLIATINYTIIKAQIEDCTIVAAEAIFNWKAQSPAWVKLMDSAGNEVPGSDYTWKTLQNSDGSTKIDSNKKYHDYLNSHGANYKYDIEVTAKGTANYKGTSTQAVFRIGWASLMYDGKTYNPPKPESAKFDKVVWDGQEWDFIKAVADKTGEFITITYTGKEILPKVKNATYLGKKLRDGTDAAYWSAPYSYDYRYVYGNPNPEEGKSDASDFSQTVNATSPDSPCAMTIRFTSGGNFENYSNVFFTIAPAPLSKVSVSAIPAQKSTGKAIKPTLTLKYNSMTLKAGTDYTVAYKNNKAAGTAQAVITGKGNYSGKKTVDFKIIANNSLATIESVAAPGKVVEIVGGSAKNNAKVDIKTGAQTPGQRFKFTSAASGYWYITNVGSGKVLTVLGAKTASGTAVVQAVNKKAAAQQWRVLSTGKDDGSFYIVSKLSGGKKLYLNLAGAKTKNGAKVQVSTGNKSTAQMFEINLIKRTIKDGTYTVNSALGSNTVLAVAGASKANAAKLQLSKAGKSTAQKFKFKYDKKTGYYTVTNVKSGLKLGISGAVAGNKAYVRQLKAKTGNSQSWAIVKSGSKYQIWSALNGSTVLSVKGAKAKTGSAIWMATNKTTPAQLWTFKK